MGQSILPKAEQDVIDSFGVKLKRINLNMQNLRSMDEYEKNPECLWKYQLDFRLKTSENSYVVYRNHIIALYYFGDNQIGELKKLPENLGNLKELLCLEIINSKIKKIPDSLGRLKKLLYLHISYNPNLFSLPENLGELMNLMKLALTNNSLRYLPESIGNLVSIMYIYLNNNNLTSFPESFKNLKGRLFYIQGNPIRCLSNINFEDLGYEGYSMTIGNLTEKGKNLLKPWESVKKMDMMRRRIEQKEELYQEYDFFITDITPSIPRNFKNVMKYYNKSTQTLALQYCNDSTSLTEDEKERLIWEANSSVREILEGNYPPNNEIIKKINERLSIELNSNYKIIL